MTDRIYYTHSYSRTFDAIVTRSLQYQDRPAVVLDRTAFYPTSGGQPFDIGALNDTSVLDTIEVESDVVHIVSTPIAAGTPVLGVIDWPRRFDHMQQHTGQHVLSASFERLTGNLTVSFHMGADASTIDLSRDVAAAAVDEVEAHANAVVWEDRPVTIRFASAAEAAALPLRKEPAREGPLRLVDIAEFDLSACGGTHVSRTGAIGLIAVLGWERFKGGTRVTFVCGGRALRSHRRLRDVVSASVGAVSVIPADLPAAIDRLQAEAREQRKSIKRLQERLAFHEAQELVLAASEINGVRLVVRVLEDGAGARLKNVASAMAAAERVATALFATNPAAQVVIARSHDVALDARVILQQLIRRFGGKGGGTSDLAQGGGLAGNVREIEAAASRLLEDALSSTPAR